MAGCVLRAASPTFAVDAFLQNSNLRPCDVFRRGEAKRQNGMAHERSGLTVVVSQADGDDLAGQITDAIEFLKQNREELARLREAVGAENVSLDFGVWRKRVCAQYSRFPPELLLLAGTLGLGIELSIYGADECGAE